MKLSFTLAIIDGKKGIDLEIYDKTASVQDLLDAIQQWCDDGEIFKAYLPEEKGSCCGCPVNCCRECYVIPDAVSFYQWESYLGMPAAELVEYCLDADCLSRGIPRLRSSPCLFLQDRLCQIYPYRTLICRLYICTLMSDRASEVVYRVAAAGQGELVRRLRQEGYLLPAVQPGGAGYEQQLMRVIEAEAERADNPFKNAESYAEVPLAPFLGSFFK